MSSISVAKHNAKRTPIGVLFALAGALVASKLALRAKRRRIRFVFCEQGDGSSLTRAASKNLRATREYPSAISGRPMIALQKILYIPAKRCYNKLGKAVKLE